MLHLVLTTLRFVKVFAILLVESIQCRFSSVLYGAVGHCVCNNAELAQEDLPQEQVDPRVQDLVEGGHADRCQKEVAVQMGIVTDVIGGC